MKTLTNTYTDNKKVYHVIEKTETLAISLKEMELYVWDNTDKTGQRKHHPFLTKTNLKEAKKMAKDCGMDVVIWTEENGEIRLFVS